MSWRDWPTYSAQCRLDVQRLLRDGTSLTAYRADPTHGPGPARGSWAWKLEREAERVHQVPHVVACANGTVALTVLLQTLYPHGGELLTTALTFSATVAAVIQAGLTPVFADVERETGLLDRWSAQQMHTSRCCGTLVVDLFGCQATRATVVDACQSVGLVPITDHGVWSFNGKKNVPAGEGGAIFTRDADIAEQCRLRLGHAENFRTNWVSGNGHLNEVTACLAYHGIKQVTLRNSHRTKMARILNRMLGDHPRLTVPNLAAHALYRYPLIIDHGMEHVADALESMGVSHQRGYIQPPLHRYPAFRWIRRDLLPNTEALSQDRLLLFPQVTPTATHREMVQLAAQIRNALA